MAISFLAPAMAYYAATEESAALAAHMVLRATEAARRRIKARRDDSDES